MSESTETQKRECADSEGEKDGVASKKPKIESCAKGSDDNGVKEPSFLVEADAAEDKGSRLTMEDAWVVLLDASLDYPGKLRFFFLLFKLIYCHIHVLIPRSLFSRTSFLLFEREKRCDVFILLDLGISFRLELFNNVRTCNTRSYVYYTVNSALSLHFSLVRYIKFLFHFVVV